MLVFYKSPGGLSRLVGGRLLIFSFWRSPLAPPAEDSHEQAKDGQNDAPVEVAVNFHANVWNVVGRNHSVASHKQAHQKKENANWESQVYHV